MIISASRRTDIPAFYGDWMMNRLREGYCLVQHPIRSQIAYRVSLKPEDVDAIVFWTKYPKSLWPHLDETESRGYRFIFLFTLTPYGSPLESRLPPLEERLEIFRRLSTRLGAEKVVWRYDPIVLSNRTDESFHVREFERIASQLKGFTRRVIISFVDYYPFVARRLAKLREEGLEVFDESALRAGALPLAASLHRIALQHGLEIQSCAEELNLKEAGIAPGSCIDGLLLHQILGVRVALKKDPGQRKSCLCTVSKDIGAYDTCGHLCAYCYACRDLAVAAARCAAHDPSSPSLLGHTTAQQSR
jgi:DNA repair photolyase